MPDITVVIANEPRSYREAFGVALRSLRPRITVVVVDPLALAASIAACRPQVVVCSQLPETVDPEVRVWAVVEADGSPGVVVNVAGRQTSVDEFSLDQLLEFVDDGVSDPAS